MSTTNKLIIISAPSGSGKSTIIQRVMKDIPQLAFSISMTNRKPRGNEQHGKEYYFLSSDEFKQKINNGELLEYAEVYENMFYGTPKSEVDRISKLGQMALFDIDVEGALQVIDIYGKQALSIFIEPPTIDELRMRLEKRNTDSPQKIEQRLQRAEYELSFSSKFDVVVINNDLEKATQEVERCIKDFIQDK